MGGLLGGGGGKEYVGPPLKLLAGGGAWPPSSYAYGESRCVRYGSELLLKFGAILKVTQR